MRSVLNRLLQWLGLRKQPPPDVGVREPRRPIPSGSSGSVALDEPDGGDR
jgi:hypothetical protein